MRLLRGQDLHDIAVFELAVDRRDASVDLSARHAVAHSRVDRIGQIDRRCAGRHIHHITLGRKHEHLIRKQIDLDIFDEVLRLGILLRLEQLPDPGKGFLIALLIQPLLVFPVRRNAVFRHFVHLGRADLNLKRDTCPSDDCRMQRLVSVGLGRGNIILKPSGDRLIQIMHIAEHIVAVRHGIHDNTHRADIVDFVDRFVLGIHFTINRVNMLYPRRDRIGDMRLLQLFADTVLNALEEFLVLLALCLEPFHDLVVADWVEHLKRKILQLPLDPAHAQTVCDRRVDLHGFQCLIALLALGQILEGARVMQPIRQLDQDHADIFGHRHKHLAQIFKLLLLLGVAQHPQSGNAIHQLGYRGAELIFDLLISETGILDAVMQQRSADRIGIQSHLDHDLRHRNRMDNIRLTVAALLPFVRVGRTFVCRTDLFDIRLRVLFLHAIQQKIQFVLHSSSPLPVIRPCFAA